MPRLCAWCRRKLPEGARADMEYCKTRCRVLASEYREAEAKRATASPAPAAPGPAATPAEQLLSAAYDVRRRARLAPLQVDERLSERARVRALEHVLEELDRQAKRRPVALPYGEVWSTPVVCAEEHAPRIMARVRALAEPSASAIGFAMIPLGGGQVALAVVVAAPPGARTILSGDRQGDRQ